MASLSGLFLRATKFVRELMNGPDMNVVGIPVDEFTQRRRDEQARYRDGLARGTQNNLTTLFRDDDFTTLGFRVLPPRNLSPDDSQAGLAFAFDVPEMVGPSRVGETPQFVTSLHPMQVRSTSAAKSVGATGSAPPAKVNLQDPDTQVIPVYNGRDQRLDSLLFIHRGGVVIAVNRYDQQNLTSALIQSRELRPAAEIHPLHPENTEISIQDGVRQLNGKYASHLRSLSAAPHAARKQEPPPQIVVPSDLLPPGLVSTKGPEHFRDVAGGGTALPPSVPLSMPVAESQHQAGLPGDTGPVQPV